MSALPCRTATNDKTTDDEWTRHQLTLRQSEKSSRQRRVQKIRSMREQVAMLSRVQCVLPIVEDLDVVWDPFLNEDLKRTRDGVRRLLPASKEIQLLLNERTLLTGLIQEHALMVRSIQVSVRANIPTDDWKRCVQRWRALTHIHFRPWTIEQCAHELEKATNEMNRFIRSSDRESTGLSFMGWQDSRRIDLGSSQFQFTLTKTFKGFDLDHYVTSSWRVYTEGGVFSDIVLGGRAKVYFEMLQELSPTMCLIRCVEKYDNLPCLVHLVYLVARIDTGDGIVQIMRSVSVPEVQRAISEPTDAWACDFYWMRWEILDPSKPRSSTDFCVSLGGMLVVEDPQYLHYWLFELLSAIVRSEAWSTNRQLLEF